MYKEADAIGIEDLNMYNIWIMLEQTYPECVKKLMEQLIKIFIFNIFLFYDDRHVFNFGLFK